MVTDGGIEQRAIDGVDNLLAPSNGNSCRWSFIFQCNRTHHRFGEFVRAPGQVVLRCARCQVERHATAYPVVCDSKLKPSRRYYAAGRGPIREAGTGEHHCRHRNRLVSITRQRGRTSGSCLELDFARGDAAQNLVGLRELPTLSVLAAGKFDAGPDAVLFAVLDGALSALPLLRQRAAAQALDPRFGG